MSIDVYATRVVRYLVKMVILLSAIFGLMVVTGTSEVSADQFISDLFDSTRGAWLLFTLVAVSLAYPKFGYVKRQVRLNMAENRDGIVAVFEKSGFSFYSEERGVVIFRATTKLKRVLMMWDDKITIDTAESNFISVDGLRKDVVMIEFRLKALVEE